MAVAPGLTGIFISCREAVEIGGGGAAASNVWYMKYNRACDVLSIVASARAIRSPAK